MRTSSTRPLLAGVVALGLAITLTACSGSDDAAPAVTGTDPSSSNTDGGAASSGPATSPSVGTTTPRMSRITIDGDAALQWGDGPYGVVLAHGASYDAISWKRQAVAIAASGTTVIAVEDISPDAILAALRQLQADGKKQVALVGASAGADGVLALASQMPDVADQLILLSPNAVVDGLGKEPKLFIASRDERVGDVSPELASTAPGEQNKAILLPGKAHAQAIFRTSRGPSVLQTIIDRLARFAS